MICRPCYTKDNERAETKGSVSMTDRQQIIQRMSYRLIKSILKGDALDQQKYIKIMEVADGLPKYLASEVSKYDWTRLVSAVMKEIEKEMTYHGKEERMKIAEWLKKEYR